MPVCKVVDSLRLLQANTSSPSHARGLTMLMNSNGGASIFRAMFGQFTYHSLVETTYLSLIVFADLPNAEGKMEEACIGFVSVNDAKSNDDADADTFASTIESMQQQINVTSNNTLFINFWCVEENVLINSTTDVTEAIVKEIFKLLPDIDYVVWVCPNGVRMTAAMDKFFFLLDAPSNINSKFLLLRRSSYLPKLLVRNARVEDNDDLVPILMKHNPSIIEGKDQFFLADLISSRDERNRFFVGSTQNQLVGMLATSIDVNVPLITKIFDVDGYSDLFLQKNQGGSSAPVNIAVVGDLWALDKQVLAASIEKLGCIYVDTDDIPPPEEGLATATMICNSIKNQTSSRSQEIPPLACFILGYPRNDMQASGLFTSSELPVDIVLEFINNFDGEEKDEEEIVQTHLDAVELLRESLPTGKQWLKEFIESSESQRAVFDEVLTKICDFVWEGKQKTAFNDQDLPPANAFAATVFCIEDEFSTRGNDLLRVAFEDHDDLDYCMFMVHNNSVPSHLTRSMVNIKTRPGISFDQSMFIIHRSFFLAQEHMRVVRISDDSMAAIGEFLAPLGEDMDEIMTAAEAALGEQGVHLRENPSDTFFIAMIEHEIVGVIALTRKQLTNADVEKLRNVYRVDEIVNFERHRLRQQAIISHWVMNPVFSRFSRFMVKEVMRFYQKTILYYKPGKKMIPPPEVVDEMVAVRSRRLPQPVNIAKIIKSYADRGLAVPAQIELPSQKTFQKPLYVFLKKKISQPKIQVLTRVVVIGGGVATYPLLETLCFHPYLNFPNLFVVTEAPPKLLYNPSEDNCDDAENFYSPGCLTCNDSYDMTKGEIQSLGLAHKINLVRGHLTDIDRENRGIVISNELIFEYDILIVSSAPQDSTIKRMPSLAKVHPLTAATKGVFSIGNKTMDGRALDWVKAHNGRIVIYGTALSILSAAGRIVEEGVEASRLCLVFPDFEISLGHDTVNEFFEGKLRELGCDIRLGWQLENTYFAKNGHINALTIKPIQKLERNALGDFIETKEESEVPVTTITCDALLCCMNKQCDPDMFAAINDAGLVYDGGIVVDESFCTTDPYIFAVGPFTRFSRKYKDALPHDVFNIRETAEYVCNCVLERYLDPTRFDRDRTVNVDKTTALPALPKFKAPKAINGKLPGNLFYYRCALPNSPKENICLPTITNEGVCVVKTDQYGIIVEIIYLGSEEVEYENLSRLVGLHEASLNSASFGYDEGEIVDWIEYFRENWTTALFHDKYSEFAAAVKESLDADKGTFSAIDEVLHAAARNTDDAAVVAVRRNFTGERYEHLHELTKKQIESQTVDYLKQNKNYLNKYFTPTSGIQKTQA